MGLHAAGLSVRILDLLETDGPLRSRQISDVLQSNMDATNRALYRLRQRGLVKSRLVLVDGVGAVGVADVNEWTIGDDDE